MATDNLNLTTISSANETIGTHFPAAYNANMEAIDSAVGDNTADISALDTRIDTAEGDIDALETSLANIGTLISGNVESVSVAANTSTDLFSVNLSEGLWIVLGACRFGNVAGGMRALSISLISATLQTPRQQIITGASGFCIMESVRVIKNTSERTLYLVAQSGTACTVDNIYFYAIRIA